MTSTDTRPAHRILDTHTRHGGPGTNFLGGNNDLGPQTANAAEGTHFPTDHLARESHTKFVGGELDNPGQAIGRSATRIEPPDLGSYHMLRFLAEIVDDLERVRIANENRLRQLTRTESDADGIQRGFGLPEDSAEVAAITVLVEGARGLEAQAIKTLEKSMKQHPLGPWVKAQSGFGMKTTARLLAAIGDPTWNPLHNRPRTLAELRSYCGLRGGTQTKRQRGVVSNWSDEARKRLWVLASKCVMQKQSGSVYRNAYDAAREKYAEAVHTSECVRCGPAGKPAPIGSPLSDGHKHARGIRAVMVAILAELHTHSTSLSGHCSSDPNGQAAAEGTPTPDPGHSRCEHQNLCAGVGHTLGGAV